MPIAREASTGTSTSVDKEVLAAARERKAPLVSARPVVDIPVSTTRLTVAPAPVRAAATDWQALLANPLLRSGHSNPALTDTRELDTDVSSHVNPALTNTRQKAEDHSSHSTPSIEPRQKFTERSNRSAQTADNPRGPNRERNLGRAKQDKQRRSEIVVPSGEGAAVMGSPGQSAMVPKGVVDEIAMKTGALTTVPDVEEQIASMASQEQATTTQSLLAEAKAQGLTGTAAAMYAAQGTAAIGSGDRVAPGAESEKESAAEIAARAERTERAALGNAKRGRDRLGESEYKDLDPDQKAAVDLNTLLSKALKDDKRTRKSGKADPTAEYGTAVEEIFGDDGKTKYAPATVTLLNSIGFKAEDLDLNDFLKLKVGITAGELDSFSLDEDAGGGSASLATPESTRTNMQKDLVAAFRDTRVDQVNGGNLLGVQRALLGTDRALGFGQGDERANASMDAQLNAYFQKGLSALSQPMYAGDKDKIVKDIRDHLDDTEWQSFINYLDVSSRDAMQYRRPLTEGVNPTTGEPLEFMLPRDFRKHMGF